MVHEKLFLLFQCSNARVSEESAVTEQLLSIVRKGWKREIAQRFHLAMLSQSVAENITLISNTSYSGNSDESFNSWSIAVKCLVGILLALIIFLAIAGNLLVCVAIYSDRRLRKLGNLFIVSLSLADLFVSSLVMPFALANDLVGHWTFGPKFCNIWISFDIMCSTASILNLCAISFDRFIHIKDPLRYSRWITKTIVLATISTIWILSVLISFLPINLEWHKAKKTFTNKTLQSMPVCALDLTPTYATLSSFISFYAPCIVMVYLYSRLYIYAKKHARDIKATMTIPITPHTRNGKLLRSSHSFQAMEHKAAITLGVIVGTFLVCWVPFFCINIVAGVCKSCISDTVFKMLTWLGYCNSALNPIIYSIFNTEFREAFRRILLANLKNICCGAQLPILHAPHRQKREMNGNCVLRRDIETSMIAETTMTKWTEVPSDET